MKPKPLNLMSNLWLESGRKARENKPMNLMESPRFTALLVCVLTAAAVYLFWTVREGGAL